MVEACRRDEPREDDGILLVDDVEDTRDALRIFLKRAGFPVSTAWGGEHALRQLRDGLRPCVILLDLRMPGMDGWQVWDAIRADAALGTIPVVIVSGDLAQRARAIAAGLRDFVTKPVDFDALIAAITQYCDRHQA